ncbi:uncharacterized protein LOC142329508 [Lycorma delicatula]|uniref:uncharacterized protein LOC142329508 n=1 Tax=Lycorma delicatula TaxID=130591 RepID=UPI003F50FD89
MRELIKKNATLWANVGTINEVVLTYRTDELKWRRIVFLPFNFYWRMFMAACCSVYFGMNIFDEVFVYEEVRESYVPTSDFVSKVINLVYLTDTVLSALHKTWETVQTSMPYQPRSSLSLLLDFIALIPSRTFMKHRILHEDGSINWTMITRMNGCLRIYRVFIELINLQQLMGLNPVLVCVVQNNALIFFTALLLSSVWYTLGFKLKSDGSWLSDLQSYTDGIDINDPTEMYAFSFQQIYVVLNNKLTTDVRTDKIPEKILFTLTLYVGFILKTGYIIGHMVLSICKFQSRIYKIKDHLRVNSRCLKNEKYKKELEEYYTSFWNNWFGVYKCPLLDKLPLCLQKDILTDVYWDAIDHSHILRYFSENIKRDISLVMESKFMQPGDYIFRKGEVRSNYYYIASGVVQIMSHYDGVSPILTIASGSCLGGLSLTLPSKSPTDVICATVCEVRFLTYKNFRKALMLYIEGTKTLFTIEKEHISHAKKMFVLSKAYKKEDPTMKIYGIPQDDKLKWIKHRWRTVNNIEMQMHQFSEKYLHKIKDEQLPTEMTHTSKYLDVIVLSSEVKWDADKCCLRSACPFVLEPNCNFIKVWLSFVVILITIDCTLLPYCSTFSGEIPEYLTRWEEVLCFAYLFDIYSQAITAVRTVDKTITEPMPLLRHHLKRTIFLIDILGTIPIRGVASLFFQRNQVPVSLGLHRLLKLVRIITFLKYKHNSILESSFMNQFLKYIYIFWFFAYLSSCFAFMLVCKIDDQVLACKLNSWYLHFVDLLQGTAESYNIKDGYGYIMQSGEENFTYLVNSLHNLLQMIYECGLNPLPSVNKSDIYFHAFLIFLIFNIYMYNLSESVAICVLKRQREQIHKETCTSLRAILGEKNLHAGLLNMLDNYISLQWVSNLAVDEDLDSTRAEDMISPIVNFEKAKVILKAVRSISFFDQLDSYMVQRICDSFRLFTVPEQFIFCRSGEHSMSFNIILKGYCNLTSMLKEDLYSYLEGKTIGPGSFFPLMELAQNIPCLQTTYSITVCEVATIEAHKLREILYSDQLIVNNIKSAINFEISELDIIVSKKKYRKEKIKIPSFLPRQLQKKPKETRTTVWTKVSMKVLDFIKNPPFIINPNGRFLFFWETVKIIQVITTLLYVPAVCTLVCDVNNTSKFIVAILLDTFSLVDICQHQQAFSIANRKEVKVILLFGLLACGFKWVFISKSSSYLIGNGKNFTKYRGSFKLYWSFIRNEGGDRQVAAKIEKHFTFQYIRMKGINLKKFVKTLHPSLQSDLTFAVYYRSMLCLHDFVGKSKTFMKYLTNNVDEIHYVNGVNVINLNEVNDKIYFIRQGCVTIFNDLGDYVKMIGPGSMFGSFKVNGKTRHTLKFVSQFYTDLLFIQSDEFLQLMENYEPECRRNFIRETRKLEYVSCNLKSEEEEYKQYDFDIGTRDQNWFYKGSIFYNWCMVILSIAVPYITVYPVLFIIIAKKYLVIYYTVIYLLDVISIFRIFIGFNATYTDEKSGIYVSNLKYIRLKYITKPTGFILDLISVIPLEFIFYLKENKLIKELFLNRMARLIILIKFIRDHNERVYIKPWLRWQEYICKVTLLPFIMACTWEYIACANGCYILKAPRMIKLDPETNSAYEFSISLYEAINSFTISGSYDLSKPYTVNECVLMTIFIIGTFLFLPMMIGSYAQVLDMSNYYKSLYEYDILCMKLYLQLRDLSKSLLELLWNYSLLLWSTNNGQSVPHYVQNAPNNMKCELFFDLYGAHIKYNALFEQCHADFKFQLSGRLNRAVYFPGDFIVRKYDVDNKMYFINSGQVEAVEFDDLNVELVKDIYITGQCFGLKQGLYERSPHLVTYKARNTVELLTLAKQDWSDLKIAFPKDEQNIYKTARKLSLDVL